MLTQAGTSRQVAVASLFLLFHVGYSALGQQAAVSPTAIEQGGQLQQITVTGYVIPHVGDGAQPVTTLDRDFIEKQGDQTVSDVILRLPENVGSFSPFVNAGASFSPGGSGVSLQGLGTTSTLVLIDGHRQTAFPFPQNGFIPFVDINTIPLAAVDRIEVLKDGASAVYGSDAIAGVINVILKDEYSGADIWTYYGISQRGDDETVHQQATFGISHKLNDNGGHFSILGAIDFFENSPIDSADRGFSSNVNHLPKANPLNFDYTDHTSSKSTSPFFIGDTSGNAFVINPGFSGLVPGPGDFQVNVSPFHYNTVPGVQLVPREQRLGALVKVNVQPFENLKFYDEFTFERTKETASFTAFPISNTDVITVPVFNPFNPFGEDLLWDRGRLVNLGQRKSIAEISNFRNIVGVTLLNLPKNWFVDANFLYAETDGTIFGENFMKKSALNQALAGTLPGFTGVFFDPFFDTQTGNPVNSALLNALRYETKQDARTDLTQWLLTAGGELFDLCAGPVTLGGGLEYRSQTYVDRKDAPSRFGDVIGSGGSPNQGGRDYDRAGYAQLTIPIFGGKWSFPGMRLLEVVLSERYDSYSSFGEAWKPKFSARYKPFDDLTFRASYSEGFRAPALSELFAATIQGFIFVTDPTPPPGSPNTYEVSTTSGGNPHLQPELSYSYFAGVVWNPGSTDPEHSWWGWANGLSLYADWVEISKRSVIATVPVQFVVNNPGLFPGAVTRGADGTILNVAANFQNLGSIRVDSVSFGGTYNTKEFDWGKLDFELDATYFYHLALQNVPNGQVLDVTDASPATGSGPDFHLIASLFYSKRVFGVDRFRTGITLNFFDSEHDGNDFRGLGITLQELQAQGIGQTPTVGNWTTFDWQVSYEFGKPEEITTETPKPGYDKEGKRIIGEKAIAPAPSGPHAGRRKWLAGTTLTVGINNIFDTRPPFADAATATGTEGFDTSYANYIQRFFYFQVEKKF
jgi:iron complex outermembrane receptor protein